MPATSVPVSVADNRAVVTTAGTAVQLPALPVRTVALTAETDNTGVIVIGASTVVAALATRRGLPLSAGDTATFVVSDLSELWMDSTVSGDGVTWIGLS